MRNRPRTTFASYQEEVERENERERLALAAFRKRESLPTASQRIAARGLRILFLLAGIAAALLLWAKWGPR